MRHISLLAILLAGCGDSTTDVGEHDVGDRWQPLENDPMAPDRDAIIEAEDVMFEGDEGYSPEGSAGLTTGEYGDMLPRLSDHSGPRDYCRSINGAAIAWRLVLPVREEWPAIQVFCGTPNGIQLPEQMAIDGYMRTSPSPIGSNWIRVDNQTVMATPKLEEGCDTNKIVGAVNYTLGADSDTVTYVKDGWPVCYSLTTRNLYVVNTSGVPTGIRSDAPNLTWPNTYLVEN